MPRLLDIEAHEPRRGQAARERSVGHVVPPARAETGRVAEPALNFVRQRDRDNEFASVCLLSLGDRQRGGDVVAGMGRLLRQIGIVIIQVTNLTAVGKRRPIRRSAMCRAEQGRAGRAGPIRSRHGARDLARLGFPGPERAAQRIDDASLDLVHDDRGQVLEAQPDGEIGQLFGQSFHTR